MAGPVCRSFATQRKPAIEDDTGLCCFLKFGTLGFVAVSRAALVTSFMIAIVSNFYAAQGKRNITVAIAAVRVVAAAVDI